MKKFLTKLAQYNRSYPIIPSVIMGLLIIAAIFAPLVATHDPIQGYLGDREIPPRAPGPCGTSREVRAGGFVREADPRRNRTGARRRR